MTITTMTFEDWVEFNREVLKLYPESLFPAGLRTGSNVNLDAQKNEAKECVFIRAIRRAVSDYDR